MSYKAMKPKVIASIVLFNHSYDDIKDTLFSLSHEESVERVILVDNGGCQWAASLNEPKISYIKSPYNSGFGAGHNLAINANIGFDGYFLICNPDISFNKQSLDKLVSFAWENEYDFVSPQIIYKNGERQYSCRLLPTPGNLFLRRFLPATAIKYDATYELKDAEYDKVFSPPSVSGCFMLLTNSLLQKLNGFDERYFMYLEDVDLFYSTRKSIIVRKQQLFMFSIRDLIKVNCCFGIIFVLLLPILISGGGFLIKNDMLITNQHCVISRES